MNARSLTFERDGHYFVLGIGMLENALRAKHFLVTLAEEFYFLVFVHVAILYASVLSTSRCASLTRIRVHLGYRKCGQYCIIDRQVIGADMVGDLVKRTFDD